MNKILVGIDGSEGSRLALDKAITLISENGKIILIAVIPLLNEVSFLDKNVHKKIRYKLNELIKNIIKENSNKNINFIGMIEEGNVAEKIIDTALNLNVDLISLGSKGSSEIGIYPIGSIANKVVQYAHKPVMVVR
jgi:nucleotide-binding universal stress UspA family protein